MQGEVVEAAVGKAVAVVLGLLDAGDETDFCEGGDGFVNAAGAAAEAGELFDERGRDDLVVLAALLDLGKVTLAG